MEDLPDIADLFGAKIRLAAHIPTTGEAASTTATAHLEPFGVERVQRLYETDAVVTCGHPASDKGATMRVAAVAVQQGVTDDLYAVTVSLVGTLPDPS